MKTPEEIKKGLECCSEDGCKTCNYVDDCNTADGFSMLAFDALSYILQLEEACQNFVNVIHELAEQVPKWISVEERLPDRNEKVVVTDGVHTWDYGEFSGLAYSFARKGEGNPHEWNWKKHTVRTVNWWMPKKNALPEPPKED